MTNRTQHTRYKVYSDLHLFHRNILSFCPRPWDNVDEMSNALMDHLVDDMEDDDVLWFLGDLMFQFGTYFDWLVERMSDVKGELRWVLGNHDPVFDNHGNIRKKVQPLVDLFDFVGQADYKLHHGKHVYFSHYPLHISDADKSRLVSIHGHTHGTIPNPVGRIDVGVDSLYGLRHDVPQILEDYDFKPILLDDAMKLASLSLAGAYREREGQINF